MRVALVEAGLCYLVGVWVVWAIAGGEVGLWELPVTLVLVGVGAGVVLVWMPLTVGTRVVQRLREVDRERALRATTAGWPVAMLVVFAIFVVPGGSLLGLAGGPSTCLVGFCGVSVWLLVAVCLEGLIAVFGPGLIGAARTKAPAGETQAPTGN